MKILLLLAVVFFSTVSAVWSQPSEYQKEKAVKIEKGSVFTKIINRELPATIVYEDSAIIAFVPLKKQAPVHLLIVPKKEIYTINDATEDNALILGKMILVAKKLAKENGIAETGYRLAINTNEDAEQSVFHLHLHLLGGKKLGGMINENE